MSRLSLTCIAAGLLCSGAALSPAFAAEGTGASIPNFAPTLGTAWTSNRPKSDDFLPPASGPGPVLSDPARPYTPNGQGQPTYRIADLTNPILKPWVIEQMKKSNDDVIAGKVPFIARERCWPAGVPGLDIYNRGQPVHFIQTPKMVDDGKTLQVSVTVDDPGAFNMPWSAIQRWRRVENTPLIEDLCEPNNDFFFGYWTGAALPRADKPDF